MFANEVVEIGTVFGSIVGVWFALVGWKLLRKGGTRRAATPDPLSHEQS